MSTPEGKIKEKVKRMLKAHSKVWYFMPVQMGYGKPVLDFLLCVNGRFIAIETKAKGKKLTLRQQQTKTELESAGAKVFVVDGPESLVEAQKWIEVYVSTYNL